MRKHQPQSSLSSRRFSRNLLAVLRQYDLHHFNSGFCPAILVLAGDNPSIDDNMSCKQNIAEAKKLLKEAGYPDGIEMVIHVSTK
ncbi:MAG: hypothetical protein ACPIE8_07560, partial [Henriciella sp.]